MLTPLVALCYYRHCSGHSWSFRVCQGPSVYSRPQRDFATPYPTQNFLMANVYTDSGFPGLSKLRFCCGKSFNHVLMPELFSLWVFHSYWLSMSSSQNTFLATPAEPYYVSQFTAHHHIKKKTIYSWLNHFHQETLTIHILGFMSIASLSPQHLNTLNQERIPSP